MRNTYLRRNPWCEDPFERHAGVVRGDMVDHIIPLPEGERLNPENLQTLCRSCHAVKTRKENP